MCSQSRCAGRWWVSLDCHQSGTGVHSSSAGLQSSITWLKWCGTRKAINLGGQIFGHLERNSQNGPQKPASLQYRPLYWKIKPKTHNTRSRKFSMRQGFVDIDAPMDSMRTTAGFTHKCCLRGLIFYSFVILCPPRDGVWSSRWPTVFASVCFGPALPQ